MNQYGPKSQVGRGIAIMLTLMLTCLASARAFEGELPHESSAALFAGSSDWLTLADGSPLRDEPGASQGLEDLRLVPDSLESQNDEQAADDKSQGANDATFESELMRLQKRIDQLETAEKKRTDADKKKKEDDAKKKEDETKKAEGWQDVSTDKWTVKLGGHIQMDYINWADGDPAITGNPGTQNYFEFRRLRLSADGTGYGQLDFRLQLTLEPETVATSPTTTVTAPDVKDAYFSINEIPWLGRVRIGNFFVPFGLEAVTNDTMNIFLERSIPTGGIFTPNRQVGVALYNCSDDQSVTWATGLFFDGNFEALKQRVDDNQGVRASGRVTWTPFYDEPSNGRYLIHTGAGVLYTHDLDHKVRFAARPQTHLGPALVDTGVLDADSYTIGNLEFAAVMGPVTVQSEAYAANVNLTDGGQSLSGAYVHLSYFLTGENRIYERFGQHGAQFGRNVPTSNFFVVPGAISPGAWEVKTRYSNLNLDHFNKGQYNDITTGFNWYLNDRTRVMFDWIHPVTTAQTTYGSTQSDLLAMRFDVNW
ncbi:MAG: hypothetical protein KDB01_22490 [Planctomycetaceae bacterium]|nr:hypothetical protein [Planctomycetaceae bacterium]